MKNVTAVDRMQVLLINCGGFGAGKDRLSVSNNSITLHDTNIRMIVAGGYYDDSRGGLVRNIGASFAYLYGTRLGRDDGDSFAGGSVSAIIATGDTSVAWLESCSLAGLPGQYAARADSGTSVYMWDCDKGALSNAGAGTIQEVTEWA